MRDVLFGEDGIIKQEKKWGIPFLKTPNYGYLDNNEVLIFAFGNMYATKVPKRKLKKFRAKLQEKENSVYWFLNTLDHIKLTDIKKALQRPSYSFANGFIMHDNTFKFYRALHVDTAHKVKLSSLWLLNKEIVALLSEHVTKPGVRTDLEKIDDHLVPKKRMSIYGDKLERLPLGYENFYWSDETSEWVDYCNYEYDLD